MRTQKEINDKIKEIYQLIEKGEFDVLRGVITTDALCWVLGEDYLDDIGEKNEEE